MNAGLLAGRNGLHYAADYGQKEVIEFLLSKGANINVSYYKAVSMLLLMKVGK